MNQLLALTLETAIRLSLSRSGLLSTETLASCVGVWKDGLQRVDILSNDVGKRTTPSCVSFTPAGRLIGDPAEIQAATNPRNTHVCFKYIPLQISHTPIQSRIFGVKRLIGREFIDLRVQTEIRNLPYSVTEKRGRPSIQVDYRGHRKSFVSNSCTEKKRVQI